MARATPEIPNASMADIAFLLLTFFLVTTTINNDKGLSIGLPPPPDPNKDQEVKMQEKNIFKIQVNSSDNLLVEGEPMSDVGGLKEMIKTFITNNGKDPASSENPDKAIISFKTDRGTSHKRFVEILDICQGAYYDIYAAQAGVTNKEYREAAARISQDPAAKAIYERGKVGYPMNISIAEPT
ncbi:MAG: ExbD/TolR family protein, partial [Cytophagales bacterium]